MTEQPQTTHDEQMQQIRAEGLARLEKKREGANYQSTLSNQAQQAQLYTQQYQEPLNLYSSRANPSAMTEQPQTTHDEQMQQIRAEGLARLEKKREGAKSMRGLANDLRSSSGELYSPPNRAQIARLAEGIATILECMR
jgi:hypothetical protein